MKKIKSVKEVVEYFQHHECNLFFIGSIFGTAMVNLYPFVPNYEIITCIDPFFGTLPFIKIPSFLQNQGHQCKTFAGQFCPTNLISNPEVISYIKSKGPRPKIIFKTPDPVLEKICAEHGFQIWASPFQSFQLLGNKVGILNILQKIQVPFIPNTCSKITSYEHFKQITSLLGSQEIVVQDQTGFGGFGTMFINNQNDYKTYQSTLESGREVKVMRRRNLKCFAIVGVATKRGVIFGPLVSELIGHENLTLYLGGYCGNQIRKSYFQDQQVDLKIRRQIYRHTEKFMNYIYQQGLFKGSFGCDFSVDVDTHQVFFMEINPRITGSTCLSFELYEAQGHKFPIYLYHCLEYLGVDMELDIQALNNEWISLQHYQEQYSHLIVKAFDLLQAYIPLTFPAGIWKIENGVPKPTGRIDFRMKNLQEDEILVLPLTGMIKMAMNFKGRIQDYNFKLTEKYKNIINQMIAYRLKDKQIE